MSLWGDYEVDYLFALDQEIERVESKWAEQHDIQRALKNGRSFMYQNEPCKVLTGEVRLSYVHLFEPYANPKQPNAKKKYQVTLLIPKSDVNTYTDITTSIQAAYEKAVVDDWKGARPHLRSALIHDGDGLNTNGAPYGAECKGHWVITASSNRRPQVVHISDIKNELAPQDVYSGMYGRVTMNFYAFDSNGNRGIGCGLGNVLKTRDGEPLAGGASAEQDFAGISQAIVPGIPGTAPAYGAAPGTVPGAAPAYNAAPGTVPGTAPAYNAAPGIVPGTAPAYNAAPGIVPGATPEINPFTGAPM